MVINRSYLLCSSIILGGIVLYPIKVSGISISYFFIVFFAFYGLYSLKFKVNKFVLLSVSFLLFYSLFQFFLFGFYFSFIIQFFLILLSVLSAYYIYKKIELPLFYKAYSSICIALCLLSLFQLFSYYLGFEKGYNLEWLYEDYRFTYSSFGLPRFQSVFPEPAHFIQFLSPCIYMALFGFKGEYVKMNSWQRLIIVFSAIITFSSMLFIVLSFCVLLYLLINGSLKKNIIVSTFIVSVFYILLVFSDDFNSRVEPFITILVEGSYEVNEKMNLSSLTLINSFGVAVRSFIETYYLGLGLGTYEQSYELYTATRYLDNVPSLNSQDANSLFLRGTAELGLGFLFTLFFTVLRLVKMERSELFIKVPVLIFLLTYLFRMGNYSAYGLWFFIIFLMLDINGDGYDKTIQKL